MDRTMEGAELSRRSDIEGEAEIRQMVDLFYERVKADELIGPVFEEKVNDWSQHLPTMYRFWGSLLLGKGGYAGNPFAKHVTLDLEKAHFARWIELFLSTVDEHFEGPKAEHAKGAARSIAHSFQVRMGIDPFGVEGRIF